MKNFSLKFKDEFIKMPEGAHLLSEHAALGFPGTVGSVDCTHVLLGKCPSDYTNACTGKEGKPSLSYENIDNNYIAFCFYNLHNDN